MEWQHLYFFFREASEVSGQSGKLIWIITKHAESSGRKRKSVKKIGDRSNTGFCFEQEHCF